MIRRVLVALDASPQSRPVLATAAELAAALRAQLLGVFVEDADLVLAAHLPIVRQLTVDGIRDIDAAQVERQLRLQAQEVGRALAAEAQRVHVEWSFATRRGKVSVEVAAAAGKADLVVIGKGGWSSRGRLGSTARRIAAECATASLVLACRPPAGSAIAVVHDGSSASGRAFGTAMELAEATARGLCVLVLAADEPARRALGQEVRAAAPAAQILDTGMAPARPPNILAAAHVAHADLLLVPGGAPALPAEALVELLCDADLPVLVVK